MDSSSALLLLPLPLPVAMEPGVVVDMCDEDEYDGDVVAAVWAIVAIVLLAEPSCIVGEDDTEEAGDRDDDVDEEDDDDDEDEGVVKGELIGDDDEWLVPTTAAMLLEDDWLGADPALVLARGCAGPLICSRCDDRELSLRLLLSDRLAPKADEDGAGEAALVIVPLFEVDEAAIVVAAAWLSSFDRLNVVGCCCLLVPLVCCAHPALLAAPAALTVVAIGYICCKTRCCEVQSAVMGVPVVWTMTKYRYRC